MPAWDELLMPSVPLLEVVVRGTIVFLALTAMMRVVGQRESGGLGITDLMVVVLVAQAVSGGLVGDGTSVTDGLLLVAVILFWSVVLDAVSYRWPAVAAVLKSRPKPLVVDGELNRAAMRREFMTRDELLSQLRLHGIEDPAEIRRAYLEPNGMVSVLPRDGDGDGDSGEEAPKPSALP